MTKTLITAKEMARLVGTKVTANLSAVHKGLDVYGPNMGMNRPIRLVSFLAQTSHESHDFRYDRELWGPTPAQKRYDTRTDLGNTPERDGDGYAFRGHTAMQITGRYNTCAFRDWCRAKVDPNAPDFEEHPEAMLTDPWEGLGPLWYWDVKNLNVHSDVGNIKKVTRIINGGYNGYHDRYRRYVKIGLAFLGYRTVQKFQEDHDLIADGISGHKTWAALNVALKEQPSVEFSVSKTDDFSVAIQAFLTWLASFFTNQNKG